ncbi:MAG: PASTA domain-containing protein [Ruminococcus sp.]|nr:PASTA domain-containing protein [Ruminococcus sp.]MCM1381515.1 PASTA domain-containing protein [Muribaculaceae bacterium]MCM1479268.1 PASTA domain-containing protein [Muribaculaceae bacterium]
MERLNLCYGCMEPLDEEVSVCRRCGYRVGAPHLPSYLKPGTLLNDRYIVGKLQSYNGESARYIAFDTITETKVEIKEYMPDTLCERERDSGVIKVDPKYMPQYKAFLADFVELNKTLSKMRTLNHVNAAIDMFGDNNTAYAVFALLEGQTLGEYLKQNGGELTWDEVKRLFPPIFTTLSLVHNAGLVHRGISPENIFITNKGELKLTGFCIADARTANAELVPELYHGYAAPEQYSSSGWQGTWTDVYGISALLYRILTGVVPADAAGRQTGDTLPEAASVNRNIPRHVSKVIADGMNMSGELRIQTVTELVTRLFEQPESGSMRLSSSSTQTISIPRQGGGRNSSKKKSASLSRHGVFIAVIAAILILGFLMIFMIIWLDDNSSKGYQSSTDISAISGGYDGGFSETTTITLETMTETLISAPASQTANAAVYVMNDLTGKNYDVISKSDSYSNLAFTADYEYNDSYPKGQIFGQTIEKGETYTEGAEITVKVSLGPKYIVIPDFLGLSKKDYFNKLGELGIKYEEQEIETEDTLEGYVDGVSKDPGEKLDVETGEILTVYVAKNPPKTETEPTETEPPKTVRTDPPPTLPELPEEPAVPPVTTEETYATQEPDITIQIFD